MPSFSNFVEGCIASVTNSCLLNLIVICWTRNYSELQKILRFIDFDCLVCIKNFKCIYVRIYVGATLTLLTYFLIVIIQLHNFSKQ